MVKWNPDNQVVIRGRVVRDEFTAAYRISQNGYTYANLFLSVFDPSKAYQKNNDPTYTGYVTDLIMIRIFGHVIDENHPKGGLLERFLCSVSKNTKICVYGHISTYASNDEDGKKILKQVIIADTFRTEATKADLRQNITERAMQDGLTGLSGLADIYHGEEEMLPIPPKTYMGGLPIGEKIKGKRRKTGRKKKKKKDEIESVNELSDDTISRAIEHETNL